MAVLKYKNGSTWTALELGGKGETIDTYPVGSFYLTPPVLYGYLKEGGTGSSSNDDFLMYTCDASKILSPANIFGGSWYKIETTKTPSITDSIRKYDFLGLSYPSLLNSAFFKTTLPNNKYGGNVDTFSWGDIYFWGGFNISGIFSSLFWEDKTVSSSVANRVSVTAVFVSNLYQRIA